MRRAVLLASVAACAPCGAAIAQSGDAGPVSPLIVEALPFGRTAAGVATPVLQLGGEELVFQRRSTLGETLANQPGISADTFGGGAGRPVIRGQTAPRVKVLSDSAELLDASQVSPDHAVTVEPLLIEEIEVLRGPAALLYGGGAVAGAVNVVDSKIPRTIPANGRAAVAEGRLGTNADERAGVVGVTVGGGMLAMRLEGASRRADDYNAGGDFGRVLGSRTDSDTGTIGASLVGRMGFMGVAYTRLQSRYGLPGHEPGYEGCHPHGVTLHCDSHEEEGEHEEEHAGSAPEFPITDLKSDRFDVRGEYRHPIAGIERIRLRGGYTTYRHDEVEDAAVINTFKNQGWDGRIEVEHQAFAGWTGVVGAQVLRSDFQALGAEAFLPANETRNNAIFLLEEYTAGPVRIDLAARQDWQSITPTRPIPGRVLPPRRKHTPFSVSAGAVWTVSPGHALTLSAARSQRAPTAQELFARGVHLATNTYELGTDHLRKETSYTLDASFRRTEGATTFTLAGFANRIDDYVFASTLDQVEAFRLIRYTQQDAEFVGFEGELKRQFTDAFSAAVLADIVQGRLRNGGGDLPRIPAARLGVHLDFHKGPVTADIEAMHTFRQGRVAGYERETPGYTMVNATLAHDFELGGSTGQVYLRATNLLDELAYNHASFIKDAAPLTGRTFVLGVRTRL